MFKEPAKIIIPKIPDFPSNSDPTPLGDWDSLLDNGDFGGNENSSISLIPNKENLRSTLPRAKLSRTGSDGFFEREKKQSKRERPQKLSLPLAEKLHRKTNEDFPDSKWKMAGPGLSARENRDLITHSKTERSSRKTIEMETELRDTLSDSEHDEISGKKEKKIRSENYPNSVVRIGKIFPLGNRIPEFPRK